MGAFTPHRLCRSRHFDIRCDRRGHWIARASDGLSGGTFLTRRAALRFALFEAGGDAAFVHDAAIAGRRSDYLWQPFGTFREMP
jgi:hypothetical protein